jgi:trk system potassium uptake protein TrkA
LAEKLQKLGNEVLLIDSSPDIIESLASRFPDAQIGDCTNKDVLIL